MSPSLRPEATAPIGVFDSGLGGLTVVRCLREALPQERIVYVADQAHVPYGGRDLAEVCGFACGISAALIAQGCKAIVMACNISSATALTAVQAEHIEIPVLGVILPGAEAAAVATRAGRIGVLATEGTVKSGAYTRALRLLNPDLQVTEVACPAFVPLVEAGQTESAEAETAACRYLAELNAADVDVTILGCTHYPFLLPVLSAVAPAMRYIDPAEQTARVLAERLTQAGLCAPEDPAPLPLRHLVTTTGSLAPLAAQTRRLLPDADIAQAHWEQGRLVLCSPNRPAI